MQLKKRSRSKKAAILVVVNDATVRSLIATVLAQEDCVVIEEAVDGFEAGQKVVTFKPDVLIIDAAMERVDGMSVCRQLKYNPATKRTKIIALLDFDAEENRRKMLDAGADLILSKPVSPEALKKQLKGILENGSAEITSHDDNEKDYGIG